MTTEAAKDGTGLLPAGADKPNPFPMRPIFAAVAAALAAAGGECDCQPCRTLRSAAPDLAAFIYPLTQSEGKSS